MLIINQHINLSQFKPNHQSLMLLRILFIIVLNHLINISLIAQEEKMEYSDVDIELLKTQCAICKKDSTLTNTYLRNEKKLVNQLYHNLHIAVKSSSNDSIFTISTALKLLLDQDRYMPINYKAPFYNFYGLQMYKLKLIDESFTAFEKGLSLVNTSLEQCVISINLATFYIEQINDFDKALNYLAEAENLIKDSSNLFLLNIIYKNKALCYFYTKQYKISENYYQKNIQLENVLRDSSNLVRTYLNLANLYYEQYLDDKAIPLFQKALYLSEEIGDLLLLMLSQENMAIVHENGKEYKKALVQYKAFQSTKDSINNVERVRNLSLKEQARITEQKEQKEKELQQQQILFGTIGSAILSILLLIGYQYRSSLKKNKIIATQKQKVEQLNTIKDELLSVLGHDLRSPMQHLISVFDRSFKVLKKGDEQKLHRLLQHGNLAVSQTSILLDNVLQWVTQQNQTGYFQKETVSLFPLVQQIQATFLPITQLQKVALINEVGETNTVLADRNSLKIILRNLVDNAIKFTPENGQVRLTASTDSTGRQGIHIQDTGVGMSDDIKAKILSSSAASMDVSGRKSTGLGLRICKEFIQRHGGELTIESVEGEGSTFSVWLPKAVVG